MSAIVILDAMMLRHEADALARRGVWAVHERLADVDGCVFTPGVYIVTHVPSGRGLTRIAHPSLNDALDLMERLPAFVGEDVGLGAPLSRDDFEVTTAALEAFLARRCS